MRQRAPLVLAALVLALAPQGRSSAQPARRDVPAGEVTGLEVGVDGTLQVVPGGTLRWFATVYEVVRGRDLRPSPGTRVTAFASFSRRQAVAEATTDALGRASLAFRVPDTLEAPFDLALDATSPRGVTRRFDVNVTLLPRRTLTLVLGREQVSPGERVFAIGRLHHEVSGRPDPAREVRLRVAREGGGAAVETVTTDARGAFVVPLRAPRELGAFTVSAESEGATTVAARAEVAAAPMAPGLVVRAAPTRDLVPPGALVEVDVVVRTPDGRPVRGAILSGLSIPPPRQRTEGHEEILPVLTGADGRARVPWRVAATGGASVADVRGQLHAVRAGLGTGDAEVVVRTSRVDSVVVWSVEGGALAPALPGRLFVRVVAPDGSPRVRTLVAVEGAGTSATNASTDEDGVAVVPLGPVTTDPAGSDECSGPTVARLSVRLGSREEVVCAPVDPDATLQVSAPALSSSTQALPVVIARAARVRGTAVRVTALARRGETWLPIAEALAAAGVDHVTLELPADVIGEVWVRARPLLRDGEPVRGGGLLVYRTVADDLEARLSVEGGVARLDLAGAGDQRVSAFAFALPEAEGRALLWRLRDTLAPVAAELDDGATALGVAGLLAARTPLDTAAPAALRGGTTEPLPMPDVPVDEGLLRDPWRTRARFVRGRLGRLLRALEGGVRDHLPEHLDEVAVRGPRGWALNAEVLAHIVEDIGPEGATAMDGSELTVTSLAALDPQITYDNVARRITRERLLRLLVQLAHFVRGHDLDYGFARRGDPASWLPALLAEEDLESGEMIERAELFDGWGQPLAIRPARGGRARFRFLEPLPGYEVVSAGPDGRLGSGDDLWDPFARVLRAGSIYANAVGEDVLLARLGGVELGRATIAALAGVFEVDPSGWTDEPTASARVTWGEEPVRAPVDPQPLATRAVGGRPAVGARAAELGPAGGDLPLTLPDEARRVVVVAGALGADGRAVFASHALDAGTPVLLTARLPSRLHPGEAILVPIRLAWLGQPQDRTLEVVAEGDGAIRAEIVGAGRVRAPPHRPALITLRVSGVRTGGGALRVEVRAQGASSPLRTLSSRIAVVPAGLLRAQHDGALVQAPTRLEATLPGDARPVRAEVVVSAGAAGMARDPGLAAAARRWPALFAWSYAMRGATPPAELEAATRGSSSTATPLSAACAVVHWSARAADDASPDPPTPSGAGMHAAEVERAAAARALTLPDDPALQMAVLVALSGAASGLPAGADGVDPIAALVVRLRDLAWGTPLGARDRPALQARAAAGLLLADPRDAVGRRLVQVLREELAPGARGGLVLPAESARPGDEWVGTLALAIAARQLADDDLADRLARGAAPRAYLAMRTPSGSVTHPEDEELAFWLLAASLLGVQGADAAPAVEVRIGGASWRRVALEDGFARIPLPAAAPSVELRSARPVFARIEARYARPVVDADEGPLRVRFEGDPGHVGEAAALEIVVSSAVDESILRPVVEVVLPGAAAWTAAAHRAIAASSAVRAVERPDAAGLVRLHLQPLGARAEVRIPFPVRWIGEGRTPGLPVLAYDAARPTAMSATAGRSLELTRPQEERWP